MYLLKNMLRLHSDFPATNMFFHKNAGCSPGIFNLYLTKMIFSKWYVAIKYSILHKQKSPARLRTNSYPMREIK